MSLLIITIETPCAREIAEQPVDLRLGADVDAARGLVDDQHPGAEGEPLGERHLLLVAAAEGGARDLDRRRLHLQLAADRRRPLRVPGRPTPGHTRE